MLDQNVLNSVLGTPATGAPTDAKTKVEKGDAEAFGAAMDDASGKTKSKDKKETKDSEDTKAEKKDSKKAAEHQEDQKAQQRSQDTTAAMHMKKLLSKNVDTLSLAEK